MPSPRDIYEKIHSRLRIQCGKQKSTENLEEYFLNYLSVLIIDTGYWFHDVKDGSTSLPIPLSLLQVSGCWLLVAAIIIMTRFITFIT